MSTAVQIGGHQVGAAGVYGSEGYTGVSGCGDVPLSWVDIRRYLIDIPTPCTD